MTIRESDDRIVPFEADHQSAEVKPGNAGEGKAVRTTRDQDWASPVLSDGFFSPPVVVPASLTTEKAGTNSLIPIP